MPPDTSAVSLVDALSETGFHASVISTYSCYFPFYEEIILRRLVDRGCTNNILLVDAARCSEAFASDDTRPRRAGSDYTLIPVELKGAFHPKLILRIGKLKGALFVGSHNTTLAGFGLNDEITNEFRTSGAGARQGAEVIRAALDYFHLFVPSNMAELIQVFRSARRNVPWLEGPISLPANEGRNLLMTTGKDKELWNVLRPLLPKRTSTAFVCGPFFDKELELLKQLRDEVKPRKLIVGIDPESVEIDAAAVRGFRGAEFVNIAGLPTVPNRRESASRYLHAKVLWFDGADGELLLTGSANPSAPAFLLKSRHRNAEAVVADRRKGTAKALGIDRLAAAPQITVQDWTHIQVRQALLKKKKAGAPMSLILAVPTDNGFTAERPIGRNISLDAFAADGIVLGHAITDTEDESFLRASADVRDNAHFLRGDHGGKTVMVLVHRPDAIGRNFGGDRQRELRQALGALEEDPSQLDTLLKLTEKVIFDSDDIIVDASPVLNKHRSSERSVLPEKSSGPESLAVEASGRRTARKRKALASGDILVLLDSLIQRLGEGLTGLAQPTGQGNGEGEPGEGANDGEGKEAPPPPCYEALAEACRGKVRRLIRRMVKQLELSRSTSARRPVVQLAAVISVVHTLRTMEQRVMWRSKHLTLVDVDAEWELFEKASFALAWGTSALIPRAMHEGDGEPFQELSLVSGLIAWLAWEVGVDVRAATERTTPIDLVEENDPWYLIQAFAAVAVQLADDEEARGTFMDAVNRTPRKGGDILAWLSCHLALADRIAKVVASPERQSKPRREPRSGDLVILGPGIDPRVRIALDVAPSGGTDKICVFDPEGDGQQRHFLASYIKYVPWWEKELTPDQGIRPNRAVV